jgi:hypothetical protein
MTIAIDYGSETLPESFNFLPRTRQANNIMVNEGDLLSDVKQKWPV